MTKQTKLPGTDADRHPDLDAAGAEYVEARDVRMQCTQVEVEKKSALHALMTKYELREYKILDVQPQLLVVIEDAEETVKVRKLVETRSNGTQPEPAPVSIA